MCNTVEVYGLWNILFQTKLWFRTSSCSLELMLNKISIVERRRKGGRGRELPIVPCDRLGRRPSQSAPRKHNQENSPYTLVHLLNSQMCRPCLIIIKSCYFDYRINKLLTCSRCSICISCSVIPTYYVRWGLWPFYLNYPLVIEIRRSDHVILSVIWNLAHVLQQQSLSSKSIWKFW